ncbi:MAG: hypothetical protein ACOYM7_00560 [Paludibacter sp.]
METNMNLNEIGNRKPFNVPDNYFEQFANQFEAQMLLKPISPIKLLRPWIYMAAMFMGVFFMGKMALTVYNDNKLAATENYELYVMSQLNDVENLEFSEPIENEVSKK